MLATGLEPAGHHADGGGLCFQGRRARRRSNHQLLVARKHGNVESLGHVQLKKCFKEPKSTLTHMHARKRARAPLTKPPSDLSCS